MKPFQTITAPPQTSFLCSRFTPNLRRVCDVNQSTRLHTHVRTVNFPLNNTIAKASSSSSDTCPPAATSSSSSSLISSFKWDSDYVEQWLEKVFYASRFLALMAVLGSLLGSLLCFTKLESLEATNYRIPFLDTYLLGTVMLVFGMGLYELFVSNLDIAKSLLEEVMLLLIGLFEKSKRAGIHSALALLCFSASVLLSSGSLFLLLKLSE